MPYISLPSRRLWAAGALAVVFAATAAAQESRVGAFVGVEISALGGRSSWTRPVHAYFRSDDAGWTLVGVERLPGDDAPVSRGLLARTSPKAPAARVRATGE